MKASIVTLKLKDTQKVDWKRGLSGYLKRIYGRQWREFYDEGLCGELDHTRGSANAEVGAATLVEQNYRYYAYLEQMYMRLGNNVPLKMEFTWYDAEYGLVSSPAKHTQKNLVFEKSCTLYNLGVALTELAKEKLNDDSKVAMQSLAKATACFQYLSDNFFNSPSADLHKENTKLLSDLAHAEAQEIFLLKIVNGGAAEKQASLISKLALSASLLYESCWDYLRTEEGGLIPYGEPSWASVVTCKYYLFRTIAAHHHAIALEQQDKYGEAIAFIKLAQQNLTSSFSYRYVLKEYFDFDGLSEILKEKLTQLTKDNDFIFHESIPQGITFASLKPMDGIKAPKWEDQLAPYMSNVAEKCEKLFRGIVPMEIYEKESIYSEDKASLIRQYVNDSETADLEYSSFIEFTHLPTLLGDLKKRYNKQGTTGPMDPQADMMRDQINSWMNNIAGSRFKDPNAQLKLIESKKREILTILGGLPAEQKENVVKLKMTLVEAASSDEKLFALVTPYANELTLLQNPNELWKIFNSLSPNDSMQESLLDIDDSKNKEILDKISEIEQMAEDLRLLKEERGRTLSELKNQSNDDDITNVLLSNSKATESELKSLFRKELDKFKPLTTRIEATIFKQDSIISEIKSELDNVFNLSGLENKSNEEEQRLKKRKEFFTKIEEAATNFMIFNNDFPKGLGFYESLLKMSKDLALSVSQKEESKNENVPMGMTSDNTVVPPPLPPQPKSTTTNISEQFGNMSLGNQTSGMPLPQQQSFQQQYQPQYQVPVTGQQQGHYSQAPPPSQFPPTSQQNYAQPPNAQQPPPPAYSSTPLVPSRNYQDPYANSQQHPPPVPQQYQQHQVPGGYSQTPMVPPKQPAQSNPNMMSRKEQMEREERELQRDPTAFYKNSSVFDESLYSKYSGR
ncbi:Vacuolar-sorting protein BRO1 [Nakaseomyces bracarensis]|uniref:BRO domain-containing protein 1 n=1 Tax=Nakaseomyces bracarensis TaxID=273131 RepID=A0ABR4P109_9SACH